ncbi:SDR family oxidoreductase [Granulosicoccus antarcticus]|uniref:Quinone oxidoreductase 2 n=1 Tax=Granulosicoccus antarcticus IMCC3135 TaxID=1192854 RepID=A0A2Z2NTJ9_9GAMM|nr:SDR family oxidoreductase [Granulosicoccus antarcticus]ASJ74816.1 Quinone oxidoreductase 2 [Granulosicoccus antarcticus IMCC3135]
MIAITGANGQLGRLVIDSLLSRTDASNIVALIRNPDKTAALQALGVEVRIADYSKPETLLPALAGVRKLLLISGSEIGQRFPQHTAVIDAAQKADLELFAYTSLLKADVSPLLLAQEHKLTERAIMAAGLPAVILRNGWYTENILGNLDNTLESGKLAGASGQGRWDTAARQDYAEAAALVLTSTEEQAGKIYELAGDAGFTLQQYANEISKFGDGEVIYENIETEELASNLVQAGLPDSIAAILADAQKQVADGWLADDSGDLSRLLGRATTSLTDSLASLQS